MYNPAPTKSQNMVTDYRLDGSMFLFWDFLRDCFLLFGAAICFAISLYMFATVAAQALPGLMAILKAV